MASVRTAGHPAQWPPHIRERYGVRDRSPWATVALVAAGLLFLALVTVVGWRLSNPAVDAGVLSYQAVSDERMTIGFEVQRRASTPVTCVLRARGQDGFDVGYAVVALPTDSGRTQHVFEVRTAYRGVVGELLGCGPDGPPAGVPAAQFRPGVLPPDQPWKPTAP